MGFAFGAGRHCFGPGAEGRGVLGGAASEARGRGLVSGLDQGHGGLPGRSVRGGAVDARVGGAKEAERRSGASGRSGAEPRTGH